MTKPISFTVHKNNAEQRKRHAKSKALVACAKDLAQDKQVAGYVIFTFTANEATSVSYDAGHLPVRVLPEFVKQKILSLIEG
jgi:hypothetical protein